MRVQAHRPAADINVVRQEIEAKQVAEAAAARTGEDQCHRSAYNRRLRSYAVS